MKKMMFAASAALLIAAPGLSLAQDEHHEGGHPGGGAPHAVSAPPSRPVGPPAGAPAYHPPTAGQPGGGYHPQGPVAGQPGYNPGYHAQGPVFPGGQGGYRPQPGQFGYRPGGYGAPRAGGQAFGYGGRQFFRYRAAPYRFPGGYYGWANHAWRRGEWLPPVFITSSYFINDWYDFGLWQPNYGYEWIRVGADAVLVNLADGQVIDVVPGVYYY
jgi:hypothetical protein